MKHCLFSISYAGLWGQHRLELTEFISKAATLGYDGVMIAGKRPHLSPLDSTPERIGAIKAHLDREGISCEVIAGYTDFSGAGPGDIPALEMQIAYVEALSRIASGLGARIVRVFTAYEVVGQAPAVLWNRAVSSLRECSDRAAAYEIIIAIQNHHDIGVHSDSLLELLNDIDRPNCKLGFDAWSPALRGEEICQAAAHMAPHTVITTSADYVRLPRFQYRPEAVNYQPVEPAMVRAVPFGDGFIDYSGFFEGLKHGGFDGVSTFEMCSPLRGGGTLENLDFCARRYLEWVKRRGL